MGLIRTTIEVLCAVGILTGASLSRADPCRLGLSAQLPLQPQNGLIEAKINNQPAMLKLDTGAFTTILTPAAAQRLGLYEDFDSSARYLKATNSSSSLLGIGGARFSKMVVANDFNIGAMHASRFHLLTAELGSPGIDGLLSIDLLRKYDIDLDFADRQVRIFTAYGSCEQPTVLLQPPFYAVPLIRSNDDPLPHVHIEVDGHLFVAQIDTGADTTAIYRHAVSQMGLEPQAMAGDRRVKVHGLGPDGVDGHMHVFGAISIGDLTLKNMPVLIINDAPDDQVDVLLGADFQRRIHLWISNSAHALVMQYPPLPSPAVR